MNIWFSGLWILILQSTLLGMPLSGQDPELCPGLYFQQWPAFLSSCETGLDECVLENFNEQYSFCNSCLLLDENYEDSNNCLCVQCVIKAFAEECFATFCKEQSEHEVLQRLLLGFNAASGHTLDTKDLELETEITYFMDQEQTVYRNLLSSEKRILIQGLISNSTKRGDNESGGFGLQVIDWHHENVTERNSKTPACYDEGDARDCNTPLPLRGNHYEGTTDYEDEEDEEDEKAKISGPYIYTSTDIYTTYVPRMKTLTKWKPKKITTTMIFDESDRIRTVTDTLHKTETVYRPKYKVKTVTDYETVTIESTKTKFKHDHEIITETDLEIVTKIKYKNDIWTVTETELEEITKIIKVGKITVTETETTTEYDVYVKKKTATITDTKTTTRKDTTTATTTEYDGTRTRFRTRTKMKTKTKKLWNPRTTVTKEKTKTTTTTTTLPKLDLAAATADPNLILALKVPDDPAPLCPSKRVTKGSRHNASNLSSYEKLQVSNASNATEISISSETKSSHPSTMVMSIANYTLESLSAAPQVSKSMMMCSIAAVFIGTTMMLGFSYHSKFKDDRNDENSRSMNEVDLWSDSEEIEITNEDLRSFPIHVPEEGLGLEEMAQILSDQSHHSSLID